MKDRNIIGTCGHKLKSDISDIDKQVHANCEKNGQFSVHPDF